MTTEKPRTQDADEPAVRAADPDAADPPAADEHAADERASHEAASHEAASPGTGHTGSGDVDKAAVKARLAALLRPERGRVLLVTGLAALGVAFLLAGPTILGRATDILFDGVVSRQLPHNETKSQVLASLRAHGHGDTARVLAGMHLVPGTGVDFTRLGQVLGLAAVVYALGAAFWWAQGYLMAGVAQRIVYRIREQAELKLARLPLRHFDSTAHGDTLSRVTNDVDNISSALNEGLGPLITALLTVLGVMGMMFWISPLLAALTLAGIPLVLLVSGLVVRRAKPSFAAQWERTGALNGLVEETHSGHELVVAFGRQDSVVEEFDRQNEELFEAGFRAQFLAGVILPAVQFIGNVNFVVVAALGGYQVATGAITLGAVQAFIQYSQRFTPVTQIAALIGQLQSGLASAGRVAEFLAAPEEPEIAEPERPEPERPGPAASTPLPSPVPPPATTARTVRLEEVSFRYDPDTPLIEGLSLEAAPGETVAIVGPTGAGKTTVVNLLMRFYEVDGGRILLDGVDYRALGRDEVRRCFGMVLQDTWLFGGTIRDNIAYGREGATDEEVRAAARAAHVDEFVRVLPGGYDTVLDADSSGLSAGQRQLLTIARAFLADPGILILDEATSNVDTRTEAMIQDAMGRLRAGRTSFVIAHRLSTVRDADTIVVMDGGRVVEQGGHDALLDRRGLYHELYHSQFTQPLAS
ncbi:putative ABC transporter ATP-binding protein [Actinacidiphila reveromycinica]|uniref:Fatty acid ABC transporter ATP-binding/permease protein n=1 Tax=Actinacidiphila reveromycinica TaxID=659352 RepID=A0A7U3V0J5_9ACTN|nr:ABC transporter ATP-binding protein [Streptomyces sp. SN-593]BBB02264.1 putative ABC transporter ATP-binding protein [Streptomyces sp. SN-593]